MCFTRRGTGVTCSCFTCRWQFSENLLAAYFLWYTFPCEGGFSFSTKMNPQPTPSRWVTSWWCWCFAVWPCYFYGCCCVDCRKNPYKMRASRMVAHAVGLFSWDSWSCVHHGYSWIAWGVASWVKRRLMRQDWNFPWIMEADRKGEWKDSGYVTFKCMYDYSRATVRIKGK